jgi:hypothetical protein
MKSQITIMLLILFAVTSFGQRRDGYGIHKKNRSRIDELEKVKLIEILDMDEETTLKFFARRNEFRNSTESYMEKRDSLLNNFEEMILNDEIEDNSIYTKQVNKVFEIERSLVNNRVEFISSLSDILSEKQIGKLVVFEFKFRKDLRDLIFRHKRSSKKN